MMRMRFSWKRFPGVPSTTFLIAAILCLSATSVSAFKMVEEEELYKASSKKPFFGGSLRMVRSPQKTFDPHQTFYFTLIPNNCYNTLVRQNPRMDGFELELAESYHQPDDKTYVFTLRQGVKFHDIPPVNGRELTSADVKYSIERMTGKYAENKKEKAKYTHRYYFDGKLASIETPDRYTVVFKTKKPYAPFLRYVSTPWASIVPKEAVDKFKDLRRNVIGTGAFTLKEHVGGSYLILERNPKYFKKGLPYLDTVEVLLSMTATTNMAAFVANELDMFGANAFMLQTLEQKASDTTVLKYPGYTMGVLRMPAWNPGKLELNPPFDDIRVRRAIAMSIDKNKVVSLGAFGEGKKAVGPIPPVEPYTLPQKDQVEFNPAKAIKLLAEAGYPNGFSSTLTSWNAAYIVPAAQVIQAMLKDVGINAKLELLEMGQYMNRAAKYQYELAIHVHQAGVDPGEYLSQYFSRTSNSFKWGNKEIWKLIDEQAEIVDPVKRKARITEIQHKINADVPIVFLGTITHFTAIKPYLHYKFHLNELNQWMMEYFWLEKH